MDLPMEIELWGEFYSVLLISFQIFKKNITSETLQIKNGSSTAD